VGALTREVENIRYIKNTTTDMAQSAQLIHNYGDVISTFVGWDTLLLSALAEGAAGVMAGTANVAPAEIVAVYDAVSAGNLEHARQVWARVYPLIDAMISQPFIAAVKTGLKAAGLPVGPPREPVAELDPAAAARIAELASALRSVRASS
jgi:4-hydroxy-tetrahydrodipicolinate synthase